MTNDEDPDRTKDQALSQTELGVPVVERSDTTDFNYLGHAKP